MRTLKLRGYPNDILNKALDATLGIPQMILIMDQKKRSAPQRQTFEARPSVKLILPFSNSLDRHQARSALKNFHEALILYFQQLDIVPNPFTQRTSEIVFSNLRTLGTKFTAPYKKGQWINSTCTNQAVPYNVLWNWTHYYVWESGTNKLVIITRQ